MTKFASAVVIFAMATVFIIGLSGQATAVVGESCSARFSEASNELANGVATDREWVVVRSGPVTVEATGLTPALATRFRDEIALIDAWITEDIGPYTATVCLVSNESSISFPGYESGALRLHAHSDLPERLIVVNVHRVGFVAPASAYALAQHALWQHNGDSAFPVPIAKAIGQWYRARILDRLDQYHQDQMSLNLFNTGSVVDWTSSAQRPVQDWNPEFNFASIGVFVDFAVASYGAEVLLETDGARWSEIEGEWRVALRNDLRGRDTDTTGWIGGGAVVVGSLLVAAAAITLGLASKYRRKRRAQTPAPIPGFFSQP